MTALTLNFPVEVLFILYLLRSSNYEGFLVGGAVRDMLINSLDLISQDKAKQKQTPVKTITDFDFTTNATPNQIQDLFFKSYYTNEFGTVGVSYDQLVQQVKTSQWQFPLNNIKSSLKKQGPLTKQFLDLSQTDKIHASLEEQAAKQLDQTQTEKKMTPPPFEITTYRSEGVYQDHRRPEEVTWGDSIRQDLKRRDFTINALALTVNPAVLTKIFQPQAKLETSYQLKPDQYQLVDHHHGLKHLTQGLIKTVNDPNDRFEEDALRILRAIRLAVDLKMEIEPSTYQAIKTKADLIRKISVERITAEFFKMLISPQPARAITILDKTGLLEILIPELKRCQGVDQGGHHTTDVWTHCLNSLKFTPSQDPIVKLAALIHDIGKPQTYQIRDSQITFYNHEVVGARMARKIAHRFKFSNLQKKQLLSLVRFHMFYYQPHQTDAAIRRLIKRIGFHNLNDILAIREGDRLGSGSKETSWRLEQFKKRIMAQLNQPLDVTDLAINGHDLMQELNLAPGPILGKILNQLLELVLDQPELNAKEKLILEAKKIVAKN